MTFLDTVEVADVYVALSAGAEAGFEPSILLIGHHRHVKSVLSVILLLHNPPLVLFANGAPVVQKAFIEGMQVITDSKRFEVQFGQKVVQIVCDQEVY